MSWGSQGIQEGEWNIIARNFYGELNMWVNGINVLKELLAVFCQSLSGLGRVLMDLDSNSSRNRLATIWLMGEPMAVPWTCS